MEGRGRGSEGWERGRERKERFKKVESSRRTKSLGGMERALCSASELLLRRKKCPQNQAQWARFGLQFFPSVYISMTTEFLNLLSRIDFSV